MIKVGIYGASGYMGGAHAAVQNLNLLFGLEENTGLKRYGLHPY